MKTREHVPEHAIAVSGLKKIYRSKSGTEKMALHGIDLTVPRGSFFGLLGPNGAGKSTLINILAGLVVKTEGSVFICGHDIKNATRQARASIGVVPQELVLDPFFPVEEALEYQAGYYGIPKAKRRTRDIIEAVGLGEKAKSPARSLSGGMRRRLLVAKAMVHNPPVLVLDEPTAGVDVELRTQLWEYVKELNKNGTTVLLTTHYLEEAEALCDHLAIIHQGRIVANDTKAKIMKTIDGKQLTVWPKEPLSSIPKALAGFDATLQEDGRIEIRYRPNQTSIDEILSACVKGKITIVDLSTQEPDLEDVFRHLTKKAA